MEDDVDIWRYAILELHARNDDDDDHEALLIQKNLRSFINVKVIWFLLVLHLTMGVIILLPLHSRPNGVLEETK